ncbi:hypothetical protein [Luteipulveratus halotolerans]|nr:hypothetical protein [Luteipulveratus halotolerans]
MGEIHGSVVGDGNVSGDRNVVGNGNYTVFGDQGPDLQPYFVKKRWLLPVTERGINFVAAIITIAAAFGGWKAVMQLWENLPFDGRASAAAETPFSGVDQQMLPIYVFFGLAAAWAFVMIVRRLIRSRTMCFSRVSLLPVAAGITDDAGRGRLALLRLGGRCQMQLGRGACGGKLRFYNKPTAWIDFTASDGTTKRKVTERTPVAECTRNPKKHCYAIDEADVD